MAIKIGPLNKKVSLRSVVRTQDGVGEDIEDFTTEYSTPWASINPLRGEEQISGDQQSSRTTHSIMLWFDERIVPTDRIIYADPKRGTRTFEINLIRDVKERNEMMELICTEVKDT